MKRVISLLLSIVMLLALIPSFNISAVAAEVENDTKFIITLTWGNSPRDLDSHLIGKDSDDNEFHLDYSNKSVKDVDGNIIASLDVDDTSGYGPENTTIFKSLENVTYYFYVYNYSHDGEISGSGATVNIYKDDGSSSVLMGSYKAPSGKSGYYWNLFQIRNGKITLVNSISQKPMYNLGSANGELFESGSNNFTIYGAETAGNNLDNLNKLSNVEAEYNSYKSKFNKTININTNDLVNGVTFSKSGYQNYIVPKEVSSSEAYRALNSHNVFLYSDKKDGNPFVSTVFARTNSGQDVRYKEVRTESLNINQGKKYDVIISAGNVSGDTTYTLSQDASHKISNTTGVFKAQELYPVFKENATIFAYVQSGGKTSETIKLQLNKPSKSVAWLDDLANGNKFSLLGSDSLGITVSDSVPLIGGTNIGMDLIDFPIGVDIENDTFKISLGVDIFDTSDKDVLNNWTYFKKCCDSYSVDENKTTDQMKKIKNTLLANKFGKNYNKDAALTGDLLGYIEGQIVNGNLIVTGFSGSVAVEFMFKYNQNFSIGPVPVYLYVNAGANASMNFTAAKMLADDSVPFDFGIELNITPSLKVGGGAGVKGAASAGIWGKGSLPFKNNFSTKYRYLALKGEFGVEAELFCFKGSKTLLEGTKTIYDGYYGSSKSKSSFKASNSMNSTYSNEDIDEEVEYSVMSRSYADETSDWLGNRSPSRSKARSATNYDVNISPLKLSVFKNSKTQLVKFDDKLMLAWIDDDDSRDTYNRMKLVYSIYDNGVWSLPKAVYDDGHNDNAPTLASDGKNVFISWQKVNRTLTENDAEDLSAILENTEVYFSKYDADTDEFINTYRVTNNSTYDYLPSVVVNDGNAVLYYVNNSANDLNAPSMNNIYYCSFSGDIKTYKTDLNQITTIECANYDDITFSYIEDADGKNETSYDSEVYVDGELINEYNETSSAVTMLKYGQLDNETVAFYSDGLNIYYNKNGKVNSIFSSNRAVSGDINILNFGNETIIAWCEITASGTDLFTCSYSNGEWSEPVQLTDTGSLITDVSAQIINNTVVSVFDSTERIEKTDDEGNVYYENGFTDLCQMITTGTTDLAVSIPFIDESSFVEGETANIGVYVDNKGTNTVNGFDIVLNDTLGNEVSIAKQITLKSGESQYVELQYTVPEEFSETTLSAEVIVQGDNSTDNNIAQYSIGNTDISVGEIVVENVGDYCIITGVVENNSCIAAENVSVEIRLNDNDSDAINYVGVIDLLAGEKYVANYTLDINQIGFDENETEIPIFFTASTSTQEHLKDNNTSGGVIKAPHKHTFSNEWTVIKKANCLTSGLEENICDVCNETVQREIPATEHDYVATVINPTCTDNGYTIYTCKNCGDTFTGDYVPATGHDFVDGICVNCGQVITAIHEGETKKVTIEESGEYTYFAFTPEEDGNYIFCSDGYADTWGCLYDSDMNELESDDDDGKVNNFLINYEFESGKSYILGCKFVSDENIGSFNVTLYKNSIKQIFFTPVSPIELIENTNGSWCAINDEEYFEYYIPEFHDGDEVTVIDKNENSIDYFFRSNEGTFVSEDGNKINEWLFDYYDDQNLNHWTIGSENYYTIEYFGVEVRVPVTIVENPVASISFTPSQPIEFLENSNGYWSEDSNGEEYYYYNFYGFNEGDVLTVFNKNGTSIDYSFRASENRFVSESGDIIDYGSVICYDTQYSSPWLIDGDNYYYVEYMNAAVQVPVTIVESPIASISFTPSQPIEIFENSNGYWSEDINGEEYYNYYLPEFNDGDVLTIISKGEASVVYTYNKNNSCFEAESGEFIDYYSLNFYNNQKSNPWIIGGDNYYTIEYMGAEVQVAVTIVENPVASISFTPAKPIEFFENTNGFWDVDIENNEFFSYYLPAFEEGDVLTVVDKLGNSIDYTFDEYDYNFVSENGEIIDNNFLVLDSDQNSTPWRIGNDNYVTIVYMGAEAKIPVSIIERPEYKVQNISVGEIKQAVIFDNKYAEFLFTPTLDGMYTFYSMGDIDTYGYICDEDGKELQTDDDSGEGNNFAVEYEMTAGKTYVLKCMCFSNYNTGVFDVSVRYRDPNLGEIYLDETKQVDGEETSYLSFTPTEDECYTFDFSDLSEEYINFELYEEDTLIKYESIDGDCTSFIADLKSNTEYKLYVLGYQSYNFKIKVSILNTDNVSGISVYNPNPQIIENLNGNWGSQTKFYYYDEWRIIDDTVMTVNYTDGTKEQILLDDNISLNGYRIYSESNQSESHPWTVDSDDNIITFSYMGFTADLNVKIVPNPVEHIEISPVTKIVENNNGCINYDEYYDPGTDEWEQIEYFYYELYYIPITVNVFYTDGSTESFTTVEGRSHDNYDVWLNSNQSYDNQWTVDNDNMEIEVTYLGKTASTKVQIVKNPIADFTVSQRPVTNVDPHEMNNGESSVCPDCMINYIDFVVTYADGTTESINGADLCGNKHDGQMPDDEAPNFTFTRTLVANSGKYIFDVSYSHDESATHKWCEDGDVMSLKIGDISKELTLEINENLLIDTSALQAAIEKFNNLDADDYSETSYSNLKGIVDKNKGLIATAESQLEIDRAVKEILEAIYDLEPYLILTVSSDNGSFEVSCNEKTSTDSLYSLLFGTEIKLSAVAHEGYKFVGWYDVTNNRYFSEENSYTFKLTANTNLKAVFVKEQSATLTFTTYSNWVQSTVTKTTSEWKEVTSIDDLLPAVPYKYGYSNGRWVYDNVDVLSKLQNGESVFLIPEYDEDDTSLPTPREPENGVPALDLYYKLDDDANVGSFVMAAGIPDDCQIESVGVAFYYKDADEFDPTNFELLLNNKMLVSRFNPDVIEDIYIVNMNKLSSRYNWAVRGYVTYYDSNGNLKTIYSNQVNIVNREQV